MSLTEDTPFQVMRHTWQPVANAADLLPNMIVARTLLDVELVVARFPSGDLLAADVACPHKGARLTAGCFRGEILEGKILEGQSVIR